MALPEFTKYVVIDKYMRVCCLGGMNDVEQYFKDVEFHDDDPADFEVYVLDETYVKPVTVVEEE